LKLAYQALITSRDTSIDRICLVAETEIWRLHGPTASEKPVPFRSLVDWFDDVGRDFPGNVAICDETDRLSYTAVREQSLRVADFLYRHGLGGQRKVAVLMRRGIELPVILLGILRSNSVLIPLDYNQPAERIRNIIRDAQADCIIVDALCKHDFQDCTTAFTAEQVLDEHDATDAQPQTRQTQSQAQLQSPENSNAPAINPIEPVNTVIPGNQTDQTHTPPIQAADTAYIIFTSGSTGKPKGVVVSHGALNAYLGWAAGYYKLQEPHEPIVMPLHTSIGFDMTVTSLFLPITGGGMLKVFSEAEATPQANALSLLQVMSDPELNTVKLTPSHIALLEGIQSPSTSIKQLIVGGEDLKSNTARYAYELFEKNIRIINEYGPSEATVGCITQDWNEQFDCLSVPIGLPIDGMSAYVLDEHQLPQLEGMPGELYLSGQSLADGYWRNDRDTERSFIDNPWDTNGRMYRTGDLVRVENQRLVYLGRKDTQIKRSGYRIELSEIESTLAMHPEVKDCAVVFESSTRAPHGNAYTSDNETHCKLCGLSSRHPQGVLNNDELCEICASYLPNKARINEYFRNNDELATLVENIKRNATGNYDAVVLLSGGKDSTYSIARLVDMGLKVYAFSLDNGFISDQAKDNINRVCKTLDIDHVYGTTQHMNDIFVDSLNRYSNVCHGCFKTIYTLAMQFAEEQGINTIFTGLSRGQLFETRLNNELFADNSLPLVKIDEMVQSARLQYHAFPDAANRLLAVDSVNSGVLPEKIDIVDFYRYCHVELSDMMHYLKTRVGWVRPPDTGRSTNCLINDVGIHVHAIEQGFHNYSLPYSWDVRLGHKQRDEALEELDDDIDIARVNTILNTIGYQPVNKVSAPDALVAFVASSDNLGREELLTWASTRLPFYMQPDSIEFIHSMPLNANGKIDRKRLAPDEKSSEEKPPNINLSSFEQSVADIWQPYLTTELTHKESNFFKSGGDSLSAIRCVVALRKKGYAVEPADLFRNPTLKAFTALLESSVNKISDTNTVNTSKFSTLNQKQQEKLQKILGKNRSNP